MKDFGSGIYDRFVAVMDWVLIAALVICASTIVARQLGFYTAPASQGAEITIS